MKSSPAVIISGLAVVAAGGFVIGRITSNHEQHPSKWTEATRPERARPGASTSHNDGTGRKDATSADAHHGTRTAPMAEKLLKMEAIMRGENPLDRNRALLELIDQLAPGEFEQVVAQFRALGITQNRLGEYSLLLSAWAKADPYAALEYAKTQTQGSYASNTILSSWASIDPDAALRWAEANHSGNGANPYLAGIIRGIAETNPQRATDLLKAMPFGEQRGEALAGMMQHILKQGPEASRNWIASIDDERLRNGAVMRMAEPMAEIDPKGTADWLLNNSSEAANRQLDDVYDRWAGKDLNAALTSIDSLKTGEQKTSALSGVIHRETSNNPQAGLALIDRYPNDINDGVLRTFVRTAAQKDPELAANSISRMNDAGQRTNAYQRTLWRWLETDMPKAQAFVQANQLPEQVTRMVARRVQELQSRQ